MAVQTRTASPQLNASPGTPRLYDIFRAAISFLRPSAVQTARTSTANSLPPFGHGEYCTCHWRRRTAMAIQICILLSGCANRESTCPATRNQLEDNIGQGIIVLRSALSMYFKHEPLHGYKNRGVRTAITILTPMPPPSLYS